MVEREREDKGAWCMAEENDFRINKGIWPLDQRMVFQKWEKPTNRNKKSLCCNHASFHFTVLLVETSISSKKMWRKFK